MMMMTTLYIYVVDMKSTKDHQQKKERNAAKKKLKFLNNFKNTDVQTYERAKEKTSSKHYIKNNNV